ncbi:MAG: response regulator [Proteobacteria bacterium]|nr:response regulator [Pseudomonadota bacterium]
MDSDGHSKKEDKGKGSFAKESPAHGTMDWTPALADLSAPESREELLRRISGEKPENRTGPGHGVNGLWAPAWLPRPEGPSIPTLISATPMEPEKENPAGSLMVVTGLTGLEAARDKSRDLEDHIRRSQHLEALGTLAGGIAHDFNNILSAIMGFTELSLDAAVEGSELHGSLQEIYKAGGRARDLVRQILAFSRQVEHRKEPMNPAPIVKEALTLLRASLPSYIEIRTDIPPDTGMVLADPSQIHQVVMNLCTNSAHAMRDDGGAITIRLTRAEFSAGEAAVSENLPPGKYLILSVADTGTGMEQEILERVFDPYFSTKPKGEGTGLGLSTVHGIVTSHNGGIRIKSEPGHGTVVEVFLPMVQGAETQAAAAPVQEMPAGGSERVLLVDDEPSIVNLQKKFLEKMGYQVSAFTESPRALEALRLEPGAFDLVITDRTMPKITGGSLAEKIRALRPDLPVILCTGFSEVPEGKKASGAICRVLLKPVGFRELAQTIREVLDDRES